MTTAAAPAPNGSARTNGGEIASPQMTSSSPPCGTSAASSPSMPAPSRSIDLMSRLPCSPGAARTAATSAGAPASRALNQMGLAAVSDVLHGVGPSTSGCRRSRTRCATQGAPVVEVDWRPPAGGDPRRSSVLTACGGGTATASPRPTPTRSSGSRAGAARGDGRAGGRRRAGPARRAAAALRAADRVGRGCATRSGGRCSRPRCSRAGHPTGRRLSGCSSAARSRSSPGNEHDHVGPMTGVCSPSMPVWVVDDGAAPRAFSTLNEGPGRTLWFGVGDDEAIERLRFFRDELGPRAGAAARAPRAGRRLRARRAGPQHGRRAAHAQPGHRQPADARPAAPAIAAVGGEPAARFIAGNHHFFLNLTMAASKCASLAASDASTGSSVVSLMSRNGIEVGIQLAGMPGRWFIAAGRAGRGRAAARGLRGRRRRAGHRRLGGHRVRRPRRHGARRRAGGRGRSSAATPLRRRRAPS